MQTLRYIINKIRWGEYFGKGDAYVVAQKNGGRHGSLISSRTFRQTSVEPSPAPDGIRIGGGGECIVQRASMPLSEKLRSGPCTQAQLQSDLFQTWLIRMKEQPMRMHRKAWEYAYIAQALHERGMLSPGRRGLGFAVGQEPLSALFAAQGCEILATDLEIEKADQSGWVATAQHAHSLEMLNTRNICDPDLFQERVRFQFADMRSLQNDLGSYDFIWSSCAMEHLGSIAAGERFIIESLKYLKPGGVGVHTTEYNVSSNVFTIKRGSTVLFRRRDIERVAMQLRQKGCRIETDFTDGQLPYDRIVDEYPYPSEIHLKLMIRWYTATSFGIIIER